MNSVTSDLRIAHGRWRGRSPPGGLCAESPDCGKSAMPPSTATVPGWRRLLSFAGPGYLVAVGYMDPGNWATSVAAGSGFGYSLLSVVLLASLMAMFLQAAALRLGMVSGCDLAHACRRHFGARVNLLLWLGCEIGIVATNLAEVLGMACGLQLLFRIPLGVGVCITALDVMLVLALQRRGVRPLESFIILLTLVIAACVALQLLWLHAPPQLSPAARALLTRGLAILPAAATAIWFGAAGVGRLLVLSQVVLGLQLPCAVVPLLWFTTRRASLGRNAFRATTGAALWAIAAFIVAINFWLAYRLIL